MSVPGATIRVMPGDRERLPARVSVPAPGAGSAMLAGELLGRVRAELPAVGELEGAGAAPGVSVADRAAVDADQPDFAAVLQQFDDLDAGGELGAAREELN